MTIIDLRISPDILLFMQFITALIQTLGFGFAIFAIFQLRRENKELKERLKNQEKT